MTWPDDDPSDGGALPGGLPGNPDPQPPSAAPDPAHDDIARPGPIPIAVASGVMHTVKTSRPLRVWASCRNVPLTVCEDARLRGGSEWKDATYGQAGWDWGINFGNFQALITQLQGPRPRQTCGNWIMDCDPLGNGELLELAINCHGDPGVVDIDGGGTRLLSTGPQTKPLMNVARLPAYQAQFNVLNGLLAPSGILFFMCCITGAYAAGSAFLIEVSKLLPGRQVIAISRIGYSNGGAQARHDGSQSDEPGMRDTDFDNPAQTEQQEDNRYTLTWGDLSVLPWASPTSPHVKIALNGVIIAGASL